MGFTSTTEKSSSKNNPFIKTEENIDTEMRIEGVLQPSIARFSAHEREKEVLLQPLQLQVLDYSPADSDAYAAVKLRIVSDLGAYSNKALLSCTQGDALEILNEEWLLPIINGCFSDDASLEKISLNIFELYKILTKEDILSGSYKTSFIALGEMVLRYKSGLCTIKDIEDKVSILSSEIELKNLSGTDAVKYSFNKAIRNGDLVAAEKIYLSSKDVVALDFFEAMKIACVNKNFDMIDFLFLKTFDGITKFSTFLSRSASSLGLKVQNYFQGKIPLLLRTIDDFEFLARLPLAMQNEMMKSVDSDVIWNAFLKNQKNKVKSLNALTMLCGELIKRNEIWSRIGDQATLDCIASILDDEEKRSLVATKPPENTLVLQEPPLFSLAVNSQSLFGGGVIENSIALNGNNTSFKKIK